MPKGKKVKAPTVTQRLASIDSALYIPELCSTVGEAIVGIAGRQNKQQNEIAALEEAICPRVAARLTALERHVELQKGENQAVFQRLNGDDADKKRVFDVLATIRNKVLARVQVTEQDISAINKSVAILSHAVNRTGEARTATTPSSKADSSNAVTNLINQIKDEMGLEFTPQGMALIIRWVEQA